jgi:hypothetical protein
MTQLSTAIESDSEDLSLPGKDCYVFVSRCNLHNIQVIEKSDLRW